MINMKLFKNSQPDIVTLPTNFPSGIAVKTNSGTFYIKDGWKFKLISDRAEQSWFFTIVKAEDSALTSIKTGGKLGFRDGTIIQNIADGKIYLISQNKRRHVINPDSFKRYGLDRSKVIEVSETETKAHEQGEDL